MAEAPKDNPVDTPKVKAAAAVAAPKPQPKPAKKPEKNGYCWASAEGKVLSPVSESNPATAKCSLTKESLVITLPESRIKKRFLRL